jgi:branched-chain amino acid transport system substrate-binding protein
MMDKMETRNTMKHFAGNFTLLGFMILLVLSGISCKKISQPYDPVTPQQIQLGALISLTGSGASTGEGMQAALRIAGENAEAWLTTMGYHVAIGLRVEDTQTDTALALRKLQAMYNDGIRVVIGPYSSASVAHCKPFADRHNMLLISPSSVATSLAIPYDNVFRFATSDVVQAEAMTTMILEDEITDLVPMIRDDLWANDLLSAIAKDFQLGGGNLQDVVTYPIGTTDFSTYLTTLNDIVGQGCISCGTNKIAVYLACFGEGAQILKKAAAYPHLQQVVWYGSSAFAQNDEAIIDTVAAGFGAVHNFPCPIYGLDEAARFKWQPIEDQIVSVIGRIPDAYAFTAYDALFVSSFALAIGGNSVSFDDLKKLFVQTAESYYGVTGNTTLNRNGDRAFGNYDFWAIRNISGQFQWKKVAVYNSATGSLTRD